MRNALRKTSDSTSHLKTDDPVEFVLSDATPDRHGDTIDPAGWDLAEFKANPIALMNHNPDFVVGRWSDVKVVNEQLRGRLLMAPPNTSPRIDEFRKLVLGGIYKATSVGFRPNKTRERPNGGTHYISQTLLECSVVSIPSNPSALRVEAKALGVSESTIKALIDQPPMNATLAQRQAFARQRLAAKGDNSTMARANAAARRAVAEMEYPAADRKRDMEIINANPRDHARIIARQNREIEEEQAKAKTASVQRRHRQRVLALGPVLAELRRRGYDDAASEIMRAEIAGNKNRVAAMLVEAQEFLDGKRW